MRILTISPFYEAHGGGIEIVAGALARSLARQGHESRWAAAGFDPAPADAQLTALPLPAIDPIEKLIGLPMPLPGRAAYRLLDAEVRASDAVVIHDSLYASSLMAARLARRHGKPWVLIQHIGHIPYSSPVLRGALGLANALVTRRLLVRAPQTVFISDTVRRHFAGLLFRNPPKLLFNGVDPALFQPCPKAGISALRAALGLPADRPQMIFVGRFVEKKGLGVLRAFASLRPDIDLNMVGSGPIAPGSWGLANVRVLGRKDRGELTRLYQGCDALVLPSVGEGYPLVIQEAMACGLPVYCGQESAEADPGASRFLTGIAIDLHDPDATARRLSRSFDAAAPADRMAVADYARRTYDWDANGRWLSRRLAELA